MKVQNKSILIPYDFTKLSEEALEYAIQVAKVINNRITLVHFAANEKEENLAKIALDHLVNNELKDYDVSPQYKIVRGKFVNDFGDFLNDLHYDLVIIKTDGPKGMEKYTGSTAMKIISGSQVPFIVVQDAPKHRSIRNIVFPVDFRKENKQKLGWILFLSQFYLLHIHLVVPHYNDRGLSQKISNNLKFAQKILDKKKINYHVEELSKEESLVNYSLEYSNKIDADLIVIMFHKDMGLRNFLLGPDEQAYIINKYRIPVMCVNPRADLRKLGGFH